MGPAEAPCLDCRGLAAGRCSFVSRGDTRELLAAGACDLSKAVRTWVDRYVRARWPSAADLADDIYQDVQLLLLGEAFSFPPELVPDPVHIRRWLRTLVLNRATDFLRRERVIPKVRCGACLHFTVRSACDLATVRDANGSESPNPHLGARLDPHANPASLVPPCDEFFWRYRRTGLEGLPAEAAAAPAAGAARDEAALAVESGLLELAKSGREGRRQAFVLHEHFTGERTATAIAADLGVSERTVRRDIASGLEALRAILAERFGFTEEDLA